MPTRQDPAVWHPRYLRQAAWTEAIRRRAWAEARVESARRVLEVGSGTGVILSDLAPLTPARRFGLDLDLASVRFQATVDGAARLCCGDGLQLPFSGGAFDIVFCHYVLLWVRDAAALVAEMARVARPAGWVLCLAEPDYGGRVDFPESFEAVAIQQEASLRRQGADPRLGRRLRALAHGAGLSPVNAGVLGAEWTGSTPEDEIRAEWRVLRADLEDSLAGGKLDEAERADLAAWRLGQRVLYVPTFYAFGRKPADHQS